MLAALKINIYETTSALCNTSCVLLVYPVQDVFVTFTVSCQLPTLTTFLSIIFFIIPLNSQCGGQKTKYSYP